jgi:GDPmannose 4,6-dehydratase
MFGASQPPQNESTPFRPRSPYAVAKVYAYWMTVNYREAYNIFASNGILFNHESPRRGETFLTRKVSRAVASIIAKKQRYIYLGNLEAKRDWGYAPEYVELQWRIMQAEKPNDFVVGTGESQSVQSFVEEAFEYVGLNWKDHVRIDKKYFRPTGVEELAADARKAKKHLRWKPKINFSDLIKIMVDADMRATGLVPVGEGDDILSKKFPDRWWGVD